MSTGGGDTDSDGGAGDRTKSKSNAESAAPQGEGDSQDTRYVLALDVGTTVMRGHVYDSSGHIRGASSVKVCVCVWWGGGGAAG